MKAAKSYTVVDVGGKHVWIESRNGRYVARCTSITMARRIARLLNDDQAEREAARA